jgi:uncharacterized protein (DUF2141 family)
MPKFIPIAAALAAFATAGAASAAPIELDLAGLRAGGKLYVQVQTREQFLGADRAAGQLIDSPRAGNLVVTFDVPPGIYAATVWHDDNGNGVYDVNPGTGAPLDGWAAVNGDGLTARPTFDQVKLTIPAAGAKAAMTLHYGR